MLHQERERVMGDPGLAAVFVNPQTGDIWSEVRKINMIRVIMIMVMIQGDVYTFPSLGKTLRAIAVNGAKEFYEGETAVNLVRDIQVGQSKVHYHYKHHHAGCRLLAASSRWRT